MPDKSSPTANQCREAIFSAFISDDEALLSNAVAFIYGMVINSEATKPLLHETGLEPRRIRKTHRLLDALTNMGSQSKNASPKRHSVPIPARSGSMSESGSVTSSSVAFSSPLWWQTAVEDTPSVDSPTRPKSSELYNRLLEKTATEAIRPHNPASKHHKMILVRLSPESENAVDSLEKHERQRIIVELTDASAAHSSESQQPKSQSLFSSLQEKDEHSVESKDDTTEGDYAFELVGILLDLLQSRPSKRIITMHMVMRLLLELLSPSRDDPPLLHESHVHMLANAMSQSVGKIREGWDSDADMLALYNVWQHEYQQFMQLIDTKSDVLMSDASQLLSSHLETQSVLDEIEYFRRRPLNDAEAMQVQLHTVILLHHIYHLFQQRDRPSVIANMLSICPEHDEGTEVSMQGRDVIRCNVIETRQNGILVSVERFLFFHSDDAHLYIVSRSLNRTGHAIINHALPLLYTRTMEKPDNRYTLRLVSERKNVRGFVTTMFDESLVFGDHMKCGEVKKLIDGKISAAVKKKTKQMERVIGIGQ